MTYRPVIHSFDASTCSYKGVATVKLGEIHKISSDKDGWSYLEKLNAHVPSACFDTTSRPTCVIRDSTNLEGCVRVNVGDIFLILHSQEHYLYGLIERKQIMGWIPTTITNITDKKINDFLETYSATWGIPHFIYTALSETDRKEIFYSKDPLKILVEEFIRRNDLDRGAKTKLKNLNCKHVARVMDHGFQIKARNPSSVVMARIGKYKQ